ncbi:MAG: hypothetical protein ACRD2A_05455, partial [Vicinamibacterales bacterium]
DPDATRISWDGPAGGTMLLVNGIAYSRFSRFTFIGNRKASVAVEQSWDGSRPNFDTGNEYSDARFVDVEYGIRGGFRERGFAETSILRARFVRNTRAGVALGNFNALDIWIWQSLFEDCAIGVTNDPGAGNYHVYDSVFRRSTTADLYMRNTGGFSARGNYSNRSRAFFVSPLVSHPATIDIQRNTIVDSSDPMPIQLGNQGPALVLDNTIISPPGASGPVVSWRNWFGSDVVSIGNTFTAQSPLSVSGRLVTIDDRIVARTAVTWAEPELPAPWPNLRRTVFELPREADAKTIQRAIDAAARNGNRSVVHFPFGSYTIDQTLTLPPGDVQLVGDGAGTKLEWSGSKAGPVVQIVGPSRVALRELHVLGTATVDGVALHEIDQTGSRISLNGTELRAAEKANLFVERLEHADVQLVDVGHAMAKGASIVANGAHLTLFSGASSNNWLSYDVSGGSRVLVRDMWYEGPATSWFARIHGRATFTMQGARVATSAKTPRAFDIHDLDGSVTLLTTNFDDPIGASGNGQRANVLGLALVRAEQSPSYFSSTSVPPVHALLVNGRQFVDPVPLLGPGSRLTPNIGTIDPDFIRSMLQDARATISPTLNALSRDSSDVRIFRVWISRGVNNLKITGTTPRQN